MTAASTAVERLFSAVESRDLRLLRDVCVPEVSWRNVPESPVVGVGNVCSLIGTVTLPADEVRWEIERLSWSGRQAHVERLDRFRILGEWHEVWCHGVLVFSPDGRLVSLDDYVDLAEWRSRIGPVLDRLATRDAASVYAEVCSRSGAAMERLGALLSPDVVLDLPDSKDRFEGWCSVADVIDGDGPIDADVVVGRVESRTLEMHDDGWRCVSSDSLGRAVAVSVAVSGGRIGSLSVAPC